MNEQIVHMVGYNSFADAVVRFLFTISQHVSLSLSLSLLQQLGTNTSLGNVRLPVTNECQPNDKHTETRSTHIRPTQVHQPTRLVEPGRRCAA